MASERARNGGISSISLLTIMFIGLKLAGVINWPWIWVLAPVWGFWLLIAIGVLLYVLVEAPESQQRRRR